MPSSGYRQSRSARMRRSNASGPTVGSGDPDVTAPTLSNQAVGDLTAEGGVPAVDTDEDNGTLYMVVVPNGDTPSAAQIKAGQDSNSDPALADESIAVTTTGTQTFAAVTGLTPGTAYDAWFVHTDAASNDSTAVKADFTTEEEATGDIVATGGTITQDGDYKVHTFTASGDFEITSGSGNVEYLIVGGGGATPASMAASNAQGGGGGGRVIEGQASLSVAIFPVVVGAGGTTGNGSDSSFNSITAIGGGVGGGYTTDGGDGGSGGGAPGNSNSPGVAVGSTGYGNDGGGNSGSGYAGGGGGAGAVGVAGEFAKAGDGGDGIASSITGSSVYYGGGGGGGMGTNIGSGGVGGLGGGGNGATYPSTDAQAGAANTGGGAGGCRANQTTGAAGGSGVVIVRYYSPA